MEVLLELEGSRRILQLDQDDDPIEKLIAEMERFGDTDINACLSGGKVISDMCSFKKWNARWECYVDIDCSDIHNVQDGDQILITKTKTSEVKELGSKASTLCSRLKKPSKANAHTLRSLFPSSSSTSLKRRSSGFDPSAECVATIPQKKKKAAIRFKSSKITVLNVDSMKSVPKGKYRKELKKNGHEKVIEVKRNNSAQQIKNLILSAFKCNSYNILSCSVDGRFVASSSVPNGDELIEMTKRKCPLYIEVIKERDEATIGDTQCDAMSHDEGEGTTTSYDPVSFEESSSQADAVLQGSLDSPVYVSSDDSEDDLPRTGILEDIEETRRLRAEQDRAYQESLQIDAKKALDQAQKLEEDKKAALLSEKLATARSKLCAKFSCVQCSDGIRVLFRLPNSEKLERTFPLTALVLDFYEYVFAMGDQDSPFTIIQTIPHRELNREAVISELGLGSACVLTVVNKTDSPEPLAYLRIDGEVCEEETEDDVKESDVVLFLQKADSNRKRFMESLELSSSSPHQIRRSYLYEDVLELFTDEYILQEYPLRISYKDELAWDQGGVSRDMLSGFWEEAYKRLFDGCNLLTPVLHPQLDMHVLPTLGRIISCGYLMCSFLPLQIALPTLVCCILGPTAAIPDYMLMETFPDYLSDYERTIIKEAVACTSTWSKTLKTRVISVLSRFGYREVPTCENMKCILKQVAKYEFITKPLAAISQIHTGIPALHANFWQQQSLLNIQELYLALSATPAKVLEVLESQSSNASEERVTGYLEKFIGTMKKDTVRRFLRFVTGTSVCLARTISVEFNALSGFARRPISHTCDCILELSSTYSTYPEFVEEFEAVLSQPECGWSMDAL